MSSRITTQGPVLAETFHADAVVRKLPDDPLCLRVSLGGTEVEGFYVVYRGQEAAVQQLLEKALALFREHLAERKRDED